MDLFKMIISHFQINKFQGENNTNSRVLLIQNSLQIKCVKNSTEIKDKIDTPELNTELTCSNNKSVMKRDFIHNSKMNTTKCIEEFGTVFQNFQTKNISYPEPTSDKTNTLERYNNHEFVDLETIIPNNKIDASNSFVKEIIESETADLNSSNNEMKQHKTDEIQSDEICSVINNSCNPTLDINNVNDIEIEPEKNSVEIQTENCEVISISSDDSGSNEMNMILFSSNEENLDTDPEGYHSSDFEFITEEDAKIDNYFINDENNSNNTDEKLLEDAKNSIDLHIDQNNLVEINENVDENNFNNESNDFNREFKDFVRNGCRYHQPNDEELKIDKSYRNNHVVPEGDHFYNLFRTVEPDLGMIRYYENKSRPKRMYQEFEDIGFERQMLHQNRELDSSEEEYKEEAAESAKEILLMYPNENRRRSKRRRVRRRY